jgi:hypothetical protein
MPPLPPDTIICVSFLGERDPTDFYQFDVAFISLFRVLSSDSWAQVRLSKVHVFPSPTPQAASYTHTPDPLSPAPPPFFLFLSLTISFSLFF